MPPRPIARVQLESPLPQLDRLFDYALTDDQAAGARAGVRVKVPLKSAGRVVPGYIVQIDVEPDATRALSDVEQIVSPVEVLPDRLYSLARAVADRTVGTVSDVLRLWIPRRMVRAEKAWVGRAAVAEPTIAEEHHARAARDVDAYPGLADAVLGDGRIALTVEPGVRGKTPSWARLLACTAAVVLAAGRTAVLAVPDHRDLHVLALALADLVPADAVIRHDADQPAQERYASYLRLLDDAPCVVIGNRSVVAAPVPNAGVVVVWDDGDALYDEPLAPWPHARDVALLRQRGQGGALVFASYSRTSDVQRLVELGFCAEVSAQRPVRPSVALIDASAASEPARIPSASYRVAEQAARSGPVLVQVARPGYSPALVCASCRAPVKCASCGGPMAARRRGDAPTCVWCGRAERTWSCPACDSRALHWAGSGSVRTAAELGRAFPGVRVIVSDGEHRVFAVDGAPALVIATRGAEPVADGGYQAVLLVDGPRMLQAPELRIGESCLRWWSNAAALAAPGAPVHLIGVDGPVGRALATWTQPRYARDELRQRAEVKLPPVARMGIVEGHQDAVRTALDALVSDVPGFDEAAILGPVDSNSDDGTPRARALIRFEYGQGADIAAHLKAQVVSAAIANRRRPTRDRAVPRSRRSLTVRMDPTNPEVDDDTRP